MATIQGVYVALFGRPADPSGLEFFNQLTSNGADLSPIIGALTGSAEFQARFAGQTNEEIVSSIYRSLFGRDPEPAGLAFFLGELEAGRQTVETIAINILDGAQGSDLATLNAKLAAADLFTTRLDLDIEIEAYVGGAAAQIGREFLQGVDADNPATIESTDAAILLLFGNEPDEVGPPGSPGGPGGGGGGGGSGDGGDNGGGNNGGGNNGGGNNGGGDNGGGNNGGGGDGNVITLSPGSDVVTIVWTGQGAFRISDSDVSIALGSTVDAGEYVELSATNFLSSGPHAILMLPPANGDSRAIIEFNLALHDSADLDASQYGDQLLMGLRSDEGAKSSLWFGETGWKGYIIAYDNGNAYIYYGDAGDSTPFGGTQGYHLVASEITLVGVVQNVAQGALSVEHFIA